MKFTNSQNSYGIVARVIHWSMALAILAMFGLGKWMRSLDYYSPWYKPAPELHKSIGICLLALLIFRFVWKVANQRPDDSFLTPIEKFLSRALHNGFYLVLLALMFAGYFISTVDGRAIEVFGLLSIPSIYEQKGLEDTAGLIHELIAYFLMALVALHIAAGLKHHFINKDQTLVRMWRGRTNNNPPL